jgi:hypothetical protein
MTVHRRLMWTIVGAVASVTVATGCASSSATSSSAASTTSTAATVPSKKAVSASNLRTKRYCEVLLVRIASGGATADVYNTFPLNECPQAKWTKLDTKAIATKEGFPFAILNGPRYWLMDSIDKTASPHLQIRKTFGGITMIREASVAVGPLATATKPYTPHTVDRSTTFTFDAGRRVYELISPAGATYVMQSWSQQAAPTLAEADLAHLATRLHLPAGWRFRTRVLTAPLQVVTKTTDAKVLQDDLHNSYSLETGS